MVKGEAPKGSIRYEWIVTFTDTTFRLQSKVVSSEPSDLATVGATTDSTSVSTSYVVEKGHIISRSTIDGSVTNCTVSFVSNDEIYLVAVDAGDYLFSIPFSRNK